MTNDSFDHIDFQMEELVIEKAPPRKKKKIGGIIGKIAWFLFQTVLLLAVTL